MLFDAFHILKDFAETHPERFQEISEKEFRQEMCLSLLPSKEGTLRKTSSLSDKYLHGASAF